MGFGDLVIFPGPLFGALWVFVLPLFLYGRQNLSIAARLRSIATWYSLSVFAPGVPLLLNLAPYDDGIGLSVGLYVFASTVALLALVVLATVWDLPWGMMHLAWRPMLVALAGVFVLSWSVGRVLDLYAGGDSGPA